MSRRSHAAIVRIIDEFYESRWAMASHIRMLRYLVALLLAGCIFLSICVGWNTARLATARGLALPRLISHRPWNKLVPGETGRREES